MVIEICTRLIELHVNDEGLYRKVGQKQVVASLRSQLNNGVMQINITDINWNNPHAVVSLLKSFLNQLPDSLTTSRKFIKPHEYYYRSFNKTSFIRSIPRVHSCMSRRSPLDAAQSNQTVTLSTSAPQLRDAKVPMCAPEASGNRLSAQQDDHKKPLHRILTVDYPSQRGQL